MDIIAVLMQCTVFVLLSFSKYAVHKVDPNLTRSEAAAQLSPNATAEMGPGPAEEPGNDGVRCVNAGSG